ncbi:MAG: zinc ABC transporter substrate-binding protein [Planctomycetes bacterium]|nr:zinc ABC transporter substrate-binding protein [Planctomycetota bacterium]MCB9868466.1 zinc ABC transporter substrate-binding protein [Planctomycetota bacterium]
MLRAWLAPIVLLLIGMSACRPAVQGPVPLSVVATTGHIHDALTQLTAGSDVQLVRLCGPGVDPHSFRASTHDVHEMQAARLIVFNGFHLEAQLQPLLEGAMAHKSWAMAGAFPEPARRAWLEDGRSDVTPTRRVDPHIWNDLPGWAACVRALAARLGEVSERHRDLFRRNGERYAAAILEAHRWAGTLLAEVPVGRRYLVSGHDAFQYFAHAYGLRTLAVLGIGNDAEPDIASIRAVVEQICAHRVPVIFLESITNPKLSVALQEACQARGHRVEIAAQRLYSDDLAPTPPRNTFLGAFRGNVEVIHAALRGR